MTTFNVDGVISFTKAVKAALAGDTIALAAGDYTGLTINELKVTGVTITSQDLSHQAVVKGLIVYNSTGVTFTGLEFTADSAKGDVPFKVAQSKDITFDHLKIHGSLDGNAANDVSAFAVYKSTGVVISNSEIQQLRNVVLDGPNDTVTLTGNTVRDISGVEVKTLTDTTEKPTTTPPTTTPPATEHPTTNTPTTGTTPATEHPTTETPSTGTTPSTTPTTEHPTTEKPSTGTTPTTTPTTEHPTTDKPSTGTTPSTTPTTGAKPPETPSGEARTFVATDAGGALDGSSGGDAMKGGKGADLFHGKDGNDLLSGAAGNDTLFGDAGNDTLSGGDGNDILQGGTGLNTLIGGGGADVFTFSAGDFEGGTSRNADVIVDFSHAQGDRIDLSGVDAVTTAAGDQAFTLIGSDAFHKVAGELRYEVSGKNLVLLGDTNGDGVADVKILLTNAAGSITPGDVIL